jgi:hypothetical protein
MNLKEKPDENSFADNIPAELSGETFAWLMLIVPDGFKKSCCGFVITDLKELHGFCDLSFRYMDLI